MDRATTPTARLVGLVLAATLLVGCQAEGPTPPAPARVPSSVPTTGSSPGASEPVVESPSALPSPVPTDGPFALVYGDGPADGRSGGCSLGWGTEGRLVIGPSGGTAVVVEGGDFAKVGDTLPVLWWPKFTGRRVGNDVEVLDPDGKVVATTDQRYRIESAYPFDTRGPLVVCSGEVTPLPSVADVLAHAAAVYLAADSEFKQANERAFAAYNETSRNLKAGKELHRALAKNVVAFDGQLQIRMPYGSGPVARRLFECHTMLYHRAQGAQFAKTVSVYNKYRAQTEDKGAECAGIGNELRVALGLPEVPL